MTECFKHWHAVSLTDSVKREESADIYNMLMSFGKANWYNGERYSYSRDYLFREHRDAVLFKMTFAGRGEDEPHGNVHGIFGDIARLGAEIVTRAFTEPRTSSVLKPHWVQDQPRSAMQTRRMR